EAIGEDDEDLPHTLTKGHREITKWQRIALVAGAEDVQHCRGDVDETAAGVIREDEVARAETLEERVGHRRTILRAVRTVIELGRAIERGVVEGPRIVAAGRGVTTTGGHGAEVGRVADGPDEVRKAVREQVRSGARVIKIFSTGGVLGEGAPPEVSQFTPEETAAAVAEAHNAGLRITTHAHGSGGMRVAAEAGIDSVEHATLLDERTIRLLKE